MSYELQTMTERHRDAVIRIFNYYIEHSFAAFPEAPVPPAFFDRIMEVTRGYAAIVATAEDGAVAGFGLLRAYHAFEAFRRTAELSYFLTPGYTRQGAGSAMLERLSAEAQSLGIDRLLAQVSSLNEPSLAFHRAHGFRECGVFPGIGSKFGRRFDVVWFVRSLPGGCGEGPARL